MAEPRTYWEIIPVPYQMGPQKHRLYLLNMLKQKGVESILDVGCGTGPIYGILRDHQNLLKEEYHPKYKGVDYAPTFIEWAQKEFGEELFEQQDMRKLKEVDNSYDCVMLMHALDHVDDYKAAIAEAARVAKKYVLIVLWRAFCLEDDLVAINDRNMLSKEPDDDPWEDTFLTQYGKGALLTEFKKNNLEVEEVVEGEELISGECKYNFLFLCRKK